MSLAATHNGISRLYETFGNDGADTEKRILDPEEYSRTWYRQNPPLPVVTWSQRDNNNYEESALLSTLSYFSKNTRHFLQNYYAKSKRSILKPTVEGPAAYVLPPSESESNRQLQLLQILKRQHVEVSQLNEPITTSLPGAKHGDKPVEEKLPAGSYVIRLDQPYSRVADSLLDHEYWSPDDPQKHPYDDTGWSFTELFNLKVIRVTDPAFLTAKMSLIDPSAIPSGKLDGAGSVVAVANTGQSTLLSLIYQLKDARIAIAEKAFDAGGKKFPAGSLLISDASDATLTPVLKQLSLDALRLASAPSVATHPATRPRIAFMHTWIDTQTEGWWRYAFDNAGIPYSYISTQAVAAQADLHSLYDIIVFAPVGYGSSQGIVDGMPMYGNAVPWEKTSLTPNLGLIDSTPDMRPGLGEEGLAHLRKFVEQGGLLITSEDTARFAIDMGLAPGVSTEHTDAHVVGTVLNSVFVSPANPVAWGYGGTLPVISANGMVFNISNTVGHGGGRSLVDPYSERPSGRGTPDESDIVQGRKAGEPEQPAKQEAWEPKPLNEEEARNNPLLIPAEFRPDVILRFADSKSLLLSGLLEKGGSIAEHATVVDAHLGHGNVLLFAFNPVYRGETIGSYPMVFNAIMNYQHLGHDMTAAK